MNFSLKNIFWQSSCLKLRIEGEGVKKFLQGQTSADLYELELGQFAYSFLLSPSGIVRALLEIKFDEEGAELLCLAGDINEVYQDFEKIIFPADRVLIKHLKEIKRIQIISSITDLPEGLSDLIWLNDKQEIPGYIYNYQIADCFAFETWRIIHGLPIGMNEINAEVNPFEIGLSNLVSLDKGCYLGQESIARIARPGKFKQELRFWESNSKINVGEKLMSSLSDLSNKKLAGRITSSIENPSKGGSFGLAMVRKNALLEKNLFSEGDALLQISKPKASFLSKIL